MFPSNSALIPFVGAASFWVVQCSRVHIQRINSSAPFETTFMSFSSLHDGHHAGLAPPMWKDFISDHAHGDQNDGRRPDMNSSDCVSIAEEAIEVLVTSQAGPSNSTASVKIGETPSKPFLPIVETMNVASKCGTVQGECDEAYLGLALRPSSVSNRAGLFSTENQSDREDSDLGHEMCASSGSFYLAVGDARELIPTMGSNSPTSSGGYTYQHLGTQNCGQSYYYRIFGDEERNSFDLSKCGTHLGSFESYHQSNWRDLRVAISVPIGSRRVKLAVGMLDMESAQIAWALDFSNSLESPLRCSNSRAVLDGSDASTLEDQVRCEIGLATGPCGYYFTSPSSHQELFHWPTEDGLFGVLVIVAYDAEARVLRSTNLQEDAFVDIRTGAYTLFLEARQPFSHEPGPESSAQFRWHKSLDYLIAVSVLSVMIVIANSHLKRVEARKVESVPGARARYRGTSSQLNPEEYNWASATHAWDIASRTYANVAQRPLEDDRQGTLATSGNGSRKPKPRAVVPII